MQLTDHSEPPASSAGFKRQLGERRACQQCSTAKAKCIYKDLFTICERCDRLKKDCTQQPVNHVKRHRVAKKQASRNAQLEQKLDNLVSMISKQNSAGQSSNSQTEDLTQDPSGSETQSPFASNQYPFNSLPSPSSDNSYRRASQTDGGSISKHRISAQEVISPVLSLDPVEARRLFDSWRGPLAKGFPFVTVSDNTDFETVCAERPFLTSSIITAAKWGDLADQLHFAQQNLEYLITQLLLKGQKNLDVLQAILVTFTWMFFHIVKNPQATNLLHLAIGVVTDLGLNRVADKNTEMRLKLFAMRRPISDRLDSSNSLTHEERRSVLACYYVTSGVAVTFAKSQPLKWTSVLDESCRILEEEGDGDNDILIAYLARSQRYLDRMNDGFANQEYLVMQPSGSPTLVLVRSWQSDLRKHWDRIPASLKQNSRMLRLLYHFTHVQLYDNALDSLPPGDVAESSNKRLHKRIELHQALFDSLRSFFDDFFSIPPQEKYYTSFDLLSKSATCIVILARMYSASDISQILDSIEGPVSMAEILDRGVNFFADAERNAREAGLNLGENHLFTRWKWRLERFRDMNPIDGVPLPDVPVGSNAYSSDRAEFAASESPNNFHTTGNEMGLVTASSVANSEVMKMDFENIVWKSNDQWDGNPGISPCQMS